MNQLLQRISIITGHYGSGKTNFAVNMAVDLHKQGKKVVLVDLDIVNPYFRSADFTETLKQYNIEVIAPDFANSNVDLPVLPTRLYSVFEEDDRYIIIDVGGDDAGATALGCFSHILKEKNNYAVFYIINAYRFLTRQPEEAVQILREIEYASRLKASYIVNNSHLSQLTTSQDILSAFDYGKKTAELSGLPLAYTTAPKKLLAELAEIPELYPIDIYVKTPWDK